MDRSDSMFSKSIKSWEDAEGNSLQQFDASHEIIRIAAVPAIDQVKKKGFLNEKKFNF